MTENEYLLYKVAEECSEVAQMASKSAIFGLDETYALQDHTNAERLMHEYTDLQAVIEMLQAKGVLPLMDKSRIPEKKIKVLKYMQYSKELGIVNGN